MLQNSFNVVQLAVAALCVVIIVAAFFIWTEARRRTVQPYTDAGNLRGIHRGMVVFANSNKNNYPGVNSAGEMTSASVEERYTILFNGDYITPYYAISPEEPHKSTIVPFVDGTKLTSDNYSFAMLQLPDEGERRREWKQTLNTQAAVLSDRNTGTAASPSSIHGSPGEPWIGQVLWNDNHVGFELFDEIETRYGGGALNTADKLFEADDLDDAILIQTGN